MNLEIGMYVRTKTGIHKVFKINENATVWKYYCDKKPTGEWDSSYEYIKIKDDDIIKSSPKIIDLIEVGDLVYVDISPDDCGGIIVPRIAETERELNSLKLLIENKDYILKSIITHEQIESMEYKVKE